MSVTLYFFQIRTVITSVSDDRSLQLDASADLTLHYNRLTRWLTRSVDNIQDDSARLDGRPLPALVVDGGDEAEQQHADELGAHELAVVHLRLRRPRQERHHILRSAQGLDTGCEAHVEAGRIAADSLEGQDAR